MRIKILTSAVDDLSNGFNFYESQSKGLGSYFLESLFAEIDSLKLNAGIHLQVFGYYRLLSKHFPYAVYYKINSKTIYINAILDCRREPGNIKKRLENLGVIDE